MKPSANPHTRLTKALAAALAKRKDCHGWLNNTGAVKIGKGFIRYGHVGSSDWLGLTVDGRMLCIECKTGDARQSFHQRIFQEQIERMGGRYYLIRSVEEAIKILDGLALLQADAV